MKAPVILAVFYFKAYKQSCIWMNLRLQGHLCKERGKAF